MLLALMIKASPVKRAKLILPHFLYTSGCLYRMLSSFVKPKSMEKRCRTLPEIQVYLASRYDAKPWLHVFTLFNNIGSPAYTRHWRLPVQCRSRYHVTSEKHSNCPWESGRHLPGRIRPNWPLSIKMTSLAPAPEAAVQLAVKKSDWQISANTSQRNFIFQWKKRIFDQT